MYLELSIRKLTDLFIILMMEYPVLIPFKIHLVPGQPSSATR